MALSGKNSVVALSLLIGVASAAQGQDQTETKSEEAGEAQPAVDAEKKPDETAGEKAPEGEGKVKKMLKERPHFPKDTIAQREKHAVPAYGAVLPDRVARVVIRQTTAHADGGFDGSGNEAKPGLDLNVQANTYILQYGLNEKLSLQAGFAHFGQYNTSLNATTARQTATYAGAMAGGKATVKSQAIAEATDGIAKSLAAAGACGGSVSACTTAINNGSVSQLPSNVDDIGYKAGDNLQTTLDTFGTATANAYESTIDATILDGFKGKAGGAPGASDLEVGAQYAFIMEESLHVAAAAGVRLPTGAYKNVPLDFPATGNGKTTLGVYGMFDYEFVNSLWVSGSWQFEQDLTKAASRSGAVVKDNANDHYENLYLSFAPGAWTSYLKPLLLTYGRSFTVLSSTTTELTADGVTTTSKAPSQNYQSTIMSQSLDLTPYKLPLAIVHTTWTPVSGKNAVFVPKKEEMTFYLYWKF